MPLFLKDGDRALPEGIAGKILGRMLPSGWTFDRLPASTRAALESFRETVADDPEPEEAPLMTLQALRVLIEENAGTDPAIAAAATYLDALPRHSSAWIDRLQRGLTPDEFATFLDAAGAMKGADANEVRATKEALAARLATKEEVDEPVKVDEGAALIRGQLG